MLPVVTFKSFKILITINGKIELDKTIEDFMFLIEQGSDLLN